MNEKPAGESALEEIAVILEAARRCADLIQERPGSDAAARALRSLQAARDALEKGIAP